MAKNVSSRPAPPGFDVESVVRENPDSIVLDIELDNDVYTFAFMRPKRMHLDVILGGSPQKIAKSMTNMVLACMVAPARDEANEVFEYYPGAVLTLGNELLEAVGLKEAQVRRP